MVIVAIIMVIVAAFKYLRNKKTPAANGYQQHNNDRNDNNRGPF